MMLLTMPAIFVGCADTTSAPTHTQRTAVVYGDDEREEVFTTQDPALQTLAKRSIVALIPTRNLNVQTPDTPQLDAPLLGDTLNLCDDQRFLQQPAASQCTGTLIDDDLVLTAGHCIPDLSACRQFRFVFDYTRSANSNMPALTDDMIFHCRALIIRRLDLGGPGADGLNLDLAIVQIDRPATPTFQPVSVHQATETLMLNDPLTAIGTPLGVPFKIDQGGRLVAPGPPTQDRFQATTDSLAPQSGRGLFTPAQTLIGILRLGLAAPVPSQEA